MTTPYQTIWTLTILYPLQLEFYFGEANLPKDKFLREQIEENDGCTLVHEGRENKIWLL